MAAAYADAIQRSESSSSCSRAVNDDTDSSTFEEVFPVPPYGDHSVAMLVRNDADDATSQVGTSSSARAATSWSWTMGT
ncbi:MAG TPA: hypothetical protein VFC03_07365 [Acidimicrobiales bacterium]|nr:hypothetical protein [Acidimicrobiales bacterium]